MGPVFIGTCSWTDRSLIACGRFYPSWASTPEARLRFYASQFPIVEVDSSYYALPSPQTGALWVERTPPGFRFHVKAFSLLTHHPTRPQGLPRDLREALPAGLRARPHFFSHQTPPEVWEAVWARFREALLPLERAGKLGVVVFQFPRWFTPGPRSLEYLLVCQERLPGYRLAVEFRNALWLAPPWRERTLDFLRRHGLAFVCVDEPQGFPSSLPPLAEVTAPLAVVRFHGRNREMWERRGVTASERFNYSYAPQELAEWVPRVRMLQERAREVHLLFNTNYQDQGVVNARLMQALLEGREPSPAPDP